MQVLESKTRGCGAKRGERSSTRSAVSTDADRSAFLTQFDASHARVCAEQRRFFSLIAEAERRGVWENDGAHDMAHWLKTRYGISDWRARRWIASAHALESLPVNQ
jgi:hypothetical protein